MIKKGLTAAERELYETIRKYAPNYRPGSFRLGTRVFAGLLIPIAAIGLSYVGIVIKVSMNAGLPGPPFLAAIALTGYIDGRRGAWIALIVSSIIEILSRLEPLGASWFLWYLVCMCIVAACAPRNGQPLPRLSLLFPDLWARARRHVSSIKRNARASLEIG